MIDLFMPFRQFLKLDNICIDNNVFRLHYRVTVIMLLVFTLLVTSKQLFGEPIHCLGDTDKNKEAINNYCWIYGTYTVKKYQSGTVHKKPELTNRIERESAHLVNKANGNEAYPGVGPDNGPEITHIYYQWVCFVLLGQAALFYFPHYLWKVWEGGRLKALAANLASPIVPPQWNAKKKELIKYLSRTHIYSHNIYAIHFALCELLNLINVISQIFILDLFLGGSFFDYGAAVARFNNQQRIPKSFDDLSVDPMDQFFPKMTKCSFRFFGVSGGLQNKDYLCVLPLNIVNEKIFVMLWFWLIFLSVLSSFAIVYRLVAFALRPMRTMMIMGQLRYIKKDFVKVIVKRFNFGDWFLLYQLGKNLNPDIYKELIIELSKDLENKAVFI